MVHRSKRAPLLLHMHAQLGYLPHTELLRVVCQLLGHRIIELQRIITRFYAHRGLTPLRQDVLIGKDALERGWARLHTRCILLSFDLIRRACAAVTISAHVL